MHHIRAWFALYQGLIKPISCHETGLITSPGTCLWIVKMRKPLYDRQITNPLKTREFATEGAVGRKNARIFELRCIFIHFVFSLSAYLYISRSAIKRVTRRTKRKPLHGGGEAFHICSENCCRMFILPQSSCRSRCKRLCSRCSPCAGLRCRTY